MVGIGELTDLAGVCKIFVAAIVVCNGFAVIVFVFGGPAVFGTVGVLLIDPILDF